MSKVKQLAKDTAIYGVSSIAGRFLNWLLFPLYTWKLAEISDYGIVTNLYAWIALLVILLTFGMETSFFRFTGKNGDDKAIYGTTLTALLTTSTLFAIVTFIFRDNIAGFLGYDHMGHIIGMVGIFLAMDAFLSIPFAKLRNDKRPIKFASLKFFNIFVNIGANCFYFLLCPFLLEKAPNTAWLAFYDESKLVDYIIISNLIASGATMVLLIPDYVKAKWQFDLAIFKKMLHYAFPILIVGIAGVINQSGDKILYPILVGDGLKAQAELGIYGANYKMAIIMVMFIQAFRYAFEPFIFNQTGGKKDKKTYAEMMRYFVIFCMFIFLGVTLYIDLIKFLIGPEYHVGLRIVPIVLMAQFFFGVFYNLSLWYKLTDKTRYGAYMAIIGTIITLSINIIFVPKMGYIASAWANLACYSSMMLISYTLMQKHYPIKYDLGKIGLYIAVALALFFIKQQLRFDSNLVNYGLSTLLIGIYFAFCILQEKELKKLILRK